MAWLRVERYFTPEEEALHVDLERQAAQPVGRGLQPGQAAASLRADSALPPGTQVVPVAADITAPEGRAAAFAARADYDIVITNAGGPPPGVWSDWTRDDFIRALDANMLTPIALMQALLPGMMAQGWGRVVNITSQSVKAPIAQLGLSNAARTGLTGFVAGTARQVAPQGVTINNLLPGIHDTDRATALDGTVVKAEGITMDEAREQLGAAADHRLDEQRRPDPLSALLSVAAVLSVRS